MDRILRLGAPALAMLLLIGCGGPENASPTPGTETPSAAPSPSKDEAASPAPTPTPSAEPAPSSKEGAPGLEGPKTSAVKLDADEIANIKKLPADEQDLALKQAVCPVSEGHLGEMGIPVKVVAEGKTFYLCCEGCEGDVKADPKAVIAKLNKK